MRGKNTIFINGQHYDAVTGLPVSTPAPQPKPAAHNVSKKVISDFGPVKTPKTVQQPKPKPAVTRTTTHVKQVHATPQRSKTLRREVVKRPSGAHEATSAHTHRTPVVVAKSPSISRFASHPMPRITTEAVETTVLPSSHKPIVIQPATVTKVHKTVEHKKAAAVHKAPAMSSRELKEHLIAEKLAAAETPKHTKEKKGMRAFIQPRTATVVSACFALVVLGGYLTYLNMPSLSVRVAAAQAGINASFPEYRPDGYHFNGPIAYAPGEVSMKFQSNSGKQAYEIRQRESTWDSQAVLDNYVAKQTDTYLTYSEQGLTVYTYGSEAAWVNAGVLYTLEGDAPLSNEQVLRIASSM